MKALQFSEYGGPEVLTVADAPEPHAGPGQIRIAVKAASVNGVLLNGRRIERAALCDEDVLGVGPFRVKIQVPESLGQGSPFPDEASLTETAVMPQQTEENTAVWRIK